MGSGKKGEAVVRRLLGLGFFVQGFRCFPWIGVNFFLKDGLEVAPSSLQILQNSANLPMVAKPLYGLLSDTVYIRGEHRIPYIAIGVFLQAVSWLLIAISPVGSVSIFTIFLLVGNLGASIVEVTNDALVAETGKPLASSKDKDKAGGGELQSFAWMLGSTGGALGNLLGGVFISRLSPQTMFLFFGLILALQFLVTIFVREHSLNLPKNSGSGIRIQLSQLSGVLRKPEVSYSIAWFAISYAMIPILMGTMFFYQTQHLELNSSILGLSKVFGQGALLIWSVAYNRWLKSVPPRQLISMIQATTAVFMASDVLFVTGVYREMGVSNAAYVVVFSGLQEVLFQFKVLPFSVLMAQLCPHGCEASLMALLMSAIALATIFSGYLGVALVSMLGVSAHDFTRLPQAILIQSTCTLLPLFWVSWIPYGVGDKNI